MKRSIFVLIMITIILTLLASCARTETDVSINNEIINEIIIEKDEQINELREEIEELKDLLKSVSSGNGAIVTDTGSDPISEMIPITESTKLQDADLFSTSGTSWLFLRNSTDNRGNDLNNCYESYDKGLRSDGDQSRTYSLNGEYTEIEGTVYVPDSRKAPTRTSRIIIYGDDIILYESNVFADESQPQSFNVDISGVNKMTITMKKVTFVDNFGLSESLKIGLSDVVLYK